MSISDNIERLTSLRCLDLSNNYFDAIPRGVLQLRTLSTLFIAHNRLPSLSADVALLGTSLEWLAADNNAIESIDPAIGKLIGLRRLHLHRNRIAALPAELAQLVALAELSLYGNSSLSSLPSLSPLSLLQELWIDSSTACRDVVSSATINKQ